MFANSNSNKRSPYYSQCEFLIIITILSIHKKKFINYESLVINLFTKATLVTFSLKVLKNTNILIYWYWTEFLFICTLTFCVCHVQRFYFLILLPINMLQHNKTHLTLGLTGGENFPTSFKTTSHILIFLRCQPLNRYI